MSLLKVCCGALWAGGRRTSVTDANNRTTSYAYDDADRLVSVTNAADNLTQYRGASPERSRGDTENNLLSIADAPSGSTRFTYYAVFHPGCLCGTPTAG